MSRRAGILIILMLLVRLAITWYAYSISPDGNYTPEQSRLFWELKDVSEIMIILLTVYFTRLYLPAQFIAMCYFVFDLTGLVNSFFGESVQKFGIEQNFLGWIIAVAVLCGWVGYNLARYYNLKKITRLNEECKKDSRSKYREIRKTIDEFRDDLNTQNNKLNDIIGRITSVGSERHTS